jgi:TetR/AcrR family transcriptional regulator, regulator of cefoperazone and chloramphenicol sensitivity
MVNAAVILQRSPIDMTENSASIEDKIILAAIDCIEKYGLSGATNRQIAALAGVNNAAINYYFRSKDVLIRRCMEITLKNAFDLGEMPAMPGASAQERCIAILGDLIAGGCNYPGITRGHFHQLLTEGEYDALLVERVNQFVTDLAEDLENRGCPLAMDELKLALTQIVSNAILAVLAPRLFEIQHGLDLCKPDMRQKYVTRLVSHLLI